MFDRLLAAHIVAVTGVDGMARFEVSRVAVAVSGFNTPPHRPTAIVRGAFASIRTERTPVNHVDGRLSLARARGHRSSNSFVYSQSETEFEFLRLSSPALTFDIITA